jgi:hypothetical protein
MGRLKNILNLATVILVCATYGCGIRTKAKKACSEIKEFIKVVLLVDDVSPVCPPHINFDNYPGFRDWSRFPLKYPYHVIMIDGYEHGNIEKFNGKDIRNPRERSEYIVFWVDSLSPQETFVAFHISEKEDATKNKWGIFQYESGEVLYFPTKEELFQKLSVSDLKFYNLEYLYNRFFAERFKRK